MALFKHICQMELPEDGILFDPTTLKVEAVREDNKYQGARLTLKATLAGAIITVQVDIGFGDHVYPPPKREIFPSLLAGLPEASILMYPPETVIAEKFEAMIRFGQTNGRVKDFHDIWVATRIFPLEMTNVVEAVGGTLQRRGTAIPTEMPVGLTEPFAAIAEAGLWKGFLRRTPPVMEPPPFSQLLGELRRFFGPIIVSLSVPEGARGRWDPDGSAWR
ncbi:nucleotidyl transferase AbiEii/AbiGii toxin family protein [Mesorhizobium silamurunense]|uniref:nucleotidyl transferase AbiEii/AbiGii toxin family protein n=1 Tax=Mesorhizobium silamurunense TaxID=499528 RepID=UPI001FE86B1D|nr:nucleotidyl transferase AbiEii/AbiGii toxin family protein [Mesorhizobium silamurunense]